jgi:hypothetical protein
MSKRCGTAGASVTLARLLAIVVLYPRAGALELNADVVEELASTRVHVPRVHSAGTSHCEPYSSSDVRCRATMT